jgi:hypothetical protein
VFSIKPIYYVFSQFFFVRLTCFRVWVVGCVGRSSVETFRGEKGVDRVLKRIAILEAERKAQTGEDCLLRSITYSDGSPSEFEVSQNKESRVISEAEFESLKPRARYVVNRHIVAAHPDALPLDDA